MGQVLHGEARSGERHDNVRRQKSNTAIASFGLGVSGAVRDQSEDGSKMACAKER